MIALLLAMLAACDDHWPEGARPANAAELAEADDVITHTTRIQIALGVLAITVIAACDCGLRWEW